MMLRHSIENIFTKLSLNIVISQNWTKIETYTVKSQVFYSRLDLLSKLRPRFDPLSRASRHVLTDCDEFIKILNGPYIWIHTWFWSNCNMLEPILFGLNIPTLFCKFTQKMYRIGSMSGIHNFWMTGPLSKLIWLNSKKFIRHNKPVPLDAAIQVQILAFTGVR